MRIWIIAILSMLLVSSCNKHGTLNRLEFAQIYKDSIHAIYPNDVLLFGDDLLIYVIDTAENDTGFYHLDNIYKAYTDQPDSLPSIISRFLAPSWSTNNSIDIKSIIPIIKSESYIIQSEALLEKSKDNPMLFNKCAEDLCILYAHDNETHFAYLSASKLKQLNITQDSLKNLAVENFRKLVGESKVTHHDGNIQMVTMGGNYEASLLLLPELWHAGNFKVFGDFIVSIPNRDMLLFTGSDNKKNVEELRKLALENYKTLSYPLSPNLYKYVNGKLELYND